MPGHPQRGPGGTACDPIHHFTQFQLFYMIVKHLTETAMDHCPPLASLPDTQATADDRGLTVSRAGVNRLRLPATIIDSDGSTCTTVAEMDLGVEVPADQRGTHMSRLVECAHALAPRLALRQLDSALLHLLARMQTHAGRIECRFPWFIRKRAPISDRVSMLDVEVEMHAWIAAGAALPTLQMEVHVPVTTLCPCSKAISRYGAHNQRSRVSVCVRAASLPAISRLVTLIESQASCAVYATLKREDEKHVTETAYENPRFAEDLVRNVYALVRKQLQPSYLRVATENMESIHNHSAYAVIDQVHLPLEQLRLPSESCARIDG